MDIGEYFANLGQKIVNMLGGVLGAVLLLLLAFVVSSIVKSIVTKLLEKTKLRTLNPGQLNPDGTPKLTNGAGLIAYIGKLCYLLVFLLFIPGIFSALGVSAIADPIRNLLNSIWGYVPRILAAAIVLIVGTLIARLVRELLVPVFQKINLDKLQEKAGIQVDAEGKLSVTLAYIVYVLIMIPVVIAAIQALNISAISNPAISVLENILVFIPNIAIAIILIWVGLLIGRFAGQIVKRLLASSGADAGVHKLVGEKAAKFEFSKTVGIVVQVVLDIFFIIEGINVLNLQVLSGIGNRLISYMPNVLAAVLILVAAFFCIAAVEKAMAKGGLKEYSIFAKAALIIVAVFMILNQLGIAAAIVNAAFVIILAALGIAFAVAFGVGGRKFAADQLEKLEKKMDEEKKES